MKKLIILVSFFSITWCALALTGDGSMESPYRIQTEDDFTAWCAAGNRLTSYAVLTADVTLTGTYNGSPMGGTSGVFSGVFDGGGFTLTQAGTVTTTGNMGGIFRHVTGCVSNLTVEITGNVTATASAQVGGLCGSLQAGGVLADVRVVVRETGVLSSKNNVGILTGNIYSSTASGIRVSRCEAILDGGTVAKTGTANNGGAGGIAGFSNSPNAVIEDVVVVLRRGTLKTEGGTYAGVGGVLGFIQNACVCSNATVYVGAATLSGATTGFIAGRLNGSPAVTVAGNRALAATALTGMANYATAYFYGQTINVEAGEAVYALPTADKTAGFPIASTTTEGVTLVGASPATQVKVAPTVTTASVDAALEHDITEPVAVTFMVSVPETVGTAWPFADGADVTLVDSGDGTNVVYCITNATPQAVTVNNKTVAYTLIGYDQGLMGTMDLTKRGIGPLTLDGTHTFTGAVALENGSVTITNATNAAFERLDVAGTFALHAREDVTSMTVRASISGDAPLVKNGTGTVTLTATNRYTGITTINAGRLLVNGAHQGANYTVNANGTLGGTGTVTAETVLVQQGGAIETGLTVNGRVNIWLNGGTRAATLRVVLNEDGGVTPLTVNGALHLTGNATYKTGVEFAEGALEAITASPYARVVLARATTVDASTWANGVNPADGTIITNAGWAIVFDSEKKEIYLSRTVNYATVVPDVPSPEDAEYVANRAPPVATRIAVRGTGNGVALTADAAASAARLLNISPVFVKEGEETVATVDYGFRCSDFHAQAAGLSMSVALDTANKGAGGINGTLVVQEKTPNGDTWVNVTSVQQPELVFQQSDGLWHYTVPTVVTVPSSNMMFRVIIQ